ELFYLPARRKNRPIPALGWNNAGPGFWLLRYWQQACEEARETSSTSAELSAKLRQAICELEAPAKRPLCAAQWKPWADALTDAAPELLESKTTLNHALEQFWSERLEEQIHQHFPPTPEFAEIVLLGRGARRERLVQRLEAA